jgi:hypothetical protein
MSLVVSSAFQQSPAVQSRAFVVIGMLSNQDVDDDLLYQMLVALKIAMSTFDEENTILIVSMLRCITRVVPALEPHSRYLPNLFWLAVALLESCHLEFFEEAADLLAVTIEEMDKQGEFAHDSVSEVLMEARAPLEENSTQLDAMLGISFRTSFSFALTATLFKGIRLAQTQVAAERALRTLLRATAKAAGCQVPGEAEAPLMPDTVAFFLALLPVSTSRNSYKMLVTDAGVHHGWIPESAGREETADVPRVPSELLGIVEWNTALLATSFMGSMLQGAQGDDAESEIIYTLLSDTAIDFPEVVALV